MTARPCVRSGYCCKQAPCPFGEWDRDKNQCKYLIVEPLNIEIVEKEKKKYGVISKQ